MALHLPENLQKEVRISKEVRLVEVIIYSWYDRTNGNPYISARVYVNKDSLVGYIPFQYGNESLALHEAAKILGFDNLIRHCKENEIILYIRELNSTKKDCNNFGKEK
jgi:hypothetical protein